MTFRPGPRAGPSSTPAAAGEQLAAEIGRLPFVEHSRLQAARDRIDLAVFVTARDEHQARERRTEVLAAFDALSTSPPWWVRDLAVGVDSVV
ncbi:hypothetical protein [Terrabacter sp. 2RAF25]|uniref:hypothetical protein n=1 Tax=Terrabacter sp. 2RAF25 TaxID=3232998 RepID=UPI003F97DB31